MLTDKKVKAFVIANDAAAARKFYGETLGFKLLSEDDYGIEFEMNDALLRISMVQGEYAEAKKYTVLGWCVPEIYEAVESLKSKGVVFERYDFLQQDERGVWTAPGGTKVAWFRDTVGNLLSIDQKG